MSTLDQFLGGGPIGTRMLAPEFGPVWTADDGSVWLRAGVFAEPASYPQAAGKQGLKGLALATVSAPSAGVTELANDGATIWLAATGNGAGTVQRSADDGLTWASVDTTTGCNIHRVRRLNGKFWAVGVSSDGTAVFAADSTTGAAGTWTVRGVITGQPASSYSDTPCDIAWTGTNLVVVVPRSSTASVFFTSTNGASWTPRSAATNGASGTGCWIVARNDGACVASHTTATASVQVSTDHGVTWATVTLPVARQSQSNGAYAYGVLLGSRFFIPSSSGFAPMFADSPATTNGWTHSLAPPWAVEAGRSDLMAVCGSKLVVAGPYTYWFTSDGVSWDCLHNNTPNAGYKFGQSAATLLHTFSGGSAHRATSADMAPNAVAGGGRPGPLTPAAVYLTVYTKVAQ